jgi:hypothetical protein
MRRDDGGGRPAQIARVEAPQPQAAPPREHGSGGKHGQFRQEAAAAPAPQSAPAQQHQGGGKPDRTNSPAPPADQGQGGGKGHGKDKKG